MPVIGSKHLDRKRKAAIALEVKVPEDCCGKWPPDWRFFVKEYVSSVFICLKKDSIYRIIRSKKP